MRKAAVLILAAALLAAGCNQQQDQLKMNPEKGTLIKQRDAERHPDLPRVPEKSSIPGQMTPQ